MTEFIKNVWQFELGVTFLVAVLAVLVDYAYSWLSLPFISLTGQRSALSAREKSVFQRKLAGEMPGAFLFLIQNNEEVPVQVSKYNVRLRFTVRSTGQFFERLPLIVYAGPFDKIQPTWVSAKRDEILVEIPIIRPLKSWAFKCLVDSSVEEMEVKLEIPSRSRLRRFLERINSATFRFRNVDYHDYRAIVRQTADQVFSRLPLSYQRLRVWLPSATFGAVIYWWVSTRWLAPTPGVFDGNVTAFLLTPWVDIAMFVLGLWGISQLATNEPSQDAQGYQIPRAIRIEEWQATPVELVQQP